MTLNDDHTGMTLELVQVLFRHGERTPIKKELDTFRITELSHYEPYGLEQLTNNGKNQAYSLGCMLRKRYDNFVNARYNPDDIYAYSSDSDRTKTSLQLVLAGLYPPTPELTWNSKLPWIPIPFHCTPGRLDVMLNVERNPKFWILINGICHSSEFKKVLNDNEELLSYIYEKTGMSIRDNVIGTVQVFDILIINERLNLPLPDWYTTDIKASCSVLFAALLDIALDGMKRLSGGTVIKQFISNIQVEEAKAENARKMYLYSGHDFNIMAVLKGLRIKGIGQPDFSSALIVEKYRDGKDQVYVKVLFWDTITETMTTLKLDGQGELCHIDEFVKIAKDVIPTDKELNELLSDMDCEKLRNLSLKSH